jgi:hypothetical protein
MNPIHGCTLTLSIFDTGGVAWLKLHLLLEQGHWQKRQPHGKPLVLIFSQHNRPVLAVCAFS